MNNVTPLRKAGRATEQELLELYQEAVAALVSEFQRYNERAEIPPVSLFEAASKLFELRKYYLGDKGATG